MPSRTCPAHDELKELIEAKLTAISAGMNANHDIIYMEIKGIQKRQDEANHRTTKVEDRLDKLAPASWIIENWKWAAVGAAAFVILVISIDLQELIKMLRP